MPPSMRKQAWENLVAEGTNKLCAAGLSLAYADVSDEEKKCLGMEKVRIGMTDSTFLNLSRG